MDVAILDTDILSEVLKRKDAQVLATASRYSSQHHRLAFSAISTYEIARELRASGATRQLAGFLNLLGTSEVFPINVAVLMRAADLWADARQGGHSQGDADLIIAATALEAGRVLVTGNTYHFSWITGQRLADWRVARPSP